MISRPHTSPAAYALAALLLSLVGGCMTRAPAPVDERVPIVRGRPLPPPTVVVPPPVAPGAEVAAPTYTVKRGDTLHQIALDNGVDYRDLAAWNGVENPNRIRPGQVLRLAPPGATLAEAPSGVSTSPLRTVPPVAPAASEPRTVTPPAAPASTPGHGNTATYKSEPKAVKVPYSQQALAQLRAAPAPAVVEAAAPAPAAPPAAAPAAPPAAAPATIATAPASSSAAATGARIPEIDDDDKLGWVWPAAGKVVNGFSETANLKGIDIAGKAGTPVLASASGKVVYAGAGLRGYGKLIIIKHNKTFLTAYAHNREILVKEGEQVTRGQQIAEMGSSDSDQVKLHFEIRRLGKPIDPSKYLPPA